MVAVNEEEIPVLVKGIEEVMGDLDTHTGVQVMALDIGFIKGAHTVDHAIDKDPLFMDAAGGDFHLQDSSPCVDSGDPAVSCNDGKRPPAGVTERNDMGAYGGPDNYDQP